MRITAGFIRCLGYGLNRVLEVNVKTPTGIRFSRNVLPFFEGNSDIILTEKPVFIPYRVKISNTHPLSIESGMHIADVCVINNGKYESTSIYNRPVLPDFTTPYLVFGVCGGVIVCIVSAFSKVLLDLL